MAASSLPVIGVTVTVGVSGVVLPPEPPESGRKVAVNDAGAVLVATVWLSFSSVTAVRVIVTEPVWP